mmetsp:Transcript_8210/g.15872  ORF Transcript_8210/g.15872 Transcript_8210/m.15872 type:complete len:222 (-) Transcript_8210:354-1019(-)
MTRGNTKPRVCGQEGPAHASTAMVTQTQTWNTTYTPRPGLSIMCAVSPGGKAQNLRPTALTPAREAGAWNCLEHKQGHWPDEHVMPVVVLCRLFASRPFYSEMVQKVCAVCVRRAHTHTLLHLSSCVSMLMGHLFLTPLLAAGAPGGYAGWPTAPRLITTRHDIWRPSAMSGQGGFWATKLRQHCLASAGRILLSQCLRPRPLSKTCPSIAAPLYRYLSYG